MTPKSPGGRGYVTPSAAHGARCGDFLPPDVPPGGGVGPRVLPTAEQWKAIGEKLSGAYGTVDLEIDGFKVTLQVKQIAVLQYGIWVFVNGWYHGKWQLQDCEERRRFMRPVSKQRHTRKFVAAMKKIYGRKNPDPEWTKKSTYYLPWWLSFAPLRRHLVANNHSIAIVEDKP